MINIPSPAWALIGVLVGFVLNEVSRLFREICRIRKLKRVLEAELQTIKVQIKDKEDILLQAIQACTTRQVLPMISVCTVRTGYDAYLGDLLHSILEARALLSACNIRAIANLG